MRQFFFVINQNPLGGAAHVLYCLRNCWSLAKARPDTPVQFIYPGSSTEAEILSTHGFSPLPNLKLRGVRALRRDLGALFTLNLLFHANVGRHLALTAKAGDWVATASFPKLLASMTRSRALKERLLFIYEVHQLELLDRGTLTSKARFELQTIARANLIVTTTAALREKLLQSFPVTIPPPILNVGLACGFDPAGFLYPRTRVDRPFAIAYIGSVYKGQGVDWLIKSWPVIQTKLPETAMLHIVGGNEAEVSTLRQLAKSSGSNPMIHGRIAPRELPRFLEGVDAVVIPAMPEGRMPHVAITKAYDFLGIKRPIIASNLASIAEILRHEREALLFEAANMESLAAALSRLMTVKNLAPNLVTAALHRANELTWQDRSDRYWQFLDQFGSAHPSSGS